MVGRSWHPGYSEEVRQAGVIGLCSGDESAQQVADRLGVSLAEIFEANRRCYGYRRMQASLARQSVMISEKVIQRLMKQEQLVVARPRRRRFGSYLGEISPAPENLINRDFHAKAPNVKWLVNGGVKTGHGAEQKSATVAPA